MITEMKDGVYYWCYSTKVKDEINELTIGILIVNCIFMLYIHIQKRERNKYI